MIPRDSRLTRHPSCLTNGVHLTLARVAEEEEQMTRMGYPGAAAHI